MTFMCSESLVVCLSAKVESWDSTEVTRSLARKLNCLLSLGLVVGGKRDLEHSFLMMMMHCDASSSRSAQSLPKP